MRSEAKVEKCVKELCLRCGICCDGTLFKDVELRPGDDTSALEHFGLKLSNRTPKKTSEGGSPRSRVQSSRFRQPCAALDGCVCRVYSERPAHCREFECGLLKAAVEGEIETAAALKLIRRTRKKADAARALLDEFGDSGAKECVSVRFRRVQRRLESGEVSQEEGSRFSRLTETVHELNLLLGAFFYPGYRFKRNS